MKSYENEKKEYAKMQKLKGAEIKPKHYLLLTRALTTKVRS
jgi:hypothetical protein